METKKNEKPWLNGTGKLRTDIEIKQICKEWTPSIWEEYLLTKESEKEEISFDDPLDVEKYSQEAHDRYNKSVFEVNELPSVQKKIDTLIRELPDKQQEVLQLIFWGKLNLREASESMGISKPSVFRLRNRALVNLGKRFIENAA